MVVPTATISLFRLDEFLLYHSGAKVARHANTC